MKTLIGIDWSQKHQDVRIHNEAGDCLAKLRIAHSLAGFQQLEEKIQQFNTEPARPAMMTAMPPCWWRYCAPTSMGLGQ